jgi:hypothetical protein
MEINFLDSFFYGEYKGSVNFINTAWQSVRLYHESLSEPLPRLLWDFRFSSGVKVVLNKKIKYLQALPVPMIRKRDGAEMTHCLRLTLTTDEAFQLSEFFTLTSQPSENKPSVSLIRTALGMIADSIVSEETLLAKMSEWRTRVALSEKLSQNDYDRALCLLFQYKKPNSIKISEPKKERRIFVPDPPRK